MKKTLIAMSLMAAVTMSMAVEVGVSAVRDYSAGKDGVRAVASLESIGNFTPQVSVTRLDKTYTRYGVGGKYLVASSGPVSLSASGSGVYQDTQVGKNGYGLTGGLTASYAVAKNVSLDVGVERFVGRSVVENRTGNVVSVGLSSKF